MSHIARECVLYTALAFQQMRASRRRVILLATLREMEATLTDAAIAMFGALMVRAHLRARKRLEQGIAISGREGRDRLMPIATVLETVDRKSVVWGQSVTVRVDLGGRQIIKKINKQNKQSN